MPDLITGNGETPLPVLPDVLRDRGAVVTDPKYATAETAVLPEALRERGAYVKPQAGTFRGPEPSEPPVRKVATPSGYKWLKPGQEANIPWHLMKYFGKELGSRILYPIIRPRPRGFFADDPEQVLKLLDQYESGLRKIQDRRAKEGKPPVTEEEYYKQSFLRKRPITGGPAVSFDWTLPKFRKDLREQYEVYSEEAYEAEVAYRKKFGLEEPPDRSSAMGSEKDCWEDKDLSEGS
jgi:hypothetical protein